jgi:AcrR family transcriptional regulator
MPSRTQPKARACTIGPRAARRAAGSPRKRTDEVIEAAAMVFAELGYHGATTQDIADRLHMRQATLYYYFASKDAALESVCRRGVAGFIENAETVALSSDSPPEKIASIIRSHLQALEEKHAYVKVFLNERQHLRDEARKKVGRLSRRYELIVQQVFESGVEAGMMRAGLNCRFATLGLLGVCNAAADWYGKESGATVSAMAKNFADLILNGVRTQARPVAAKHKGRG